MGTPMDRTDRVFVHLAPFEKVFPDLEDVKIEYTETGDFEYFDPRYQSRTKIHSVKSQGGLIRCSNPSCRQGGYEMDFDIHDMIREGVSERSGHKICAGSEGSPKLRRIYRKCLNSIDYKITLVRKKK
jgi:site-specific DNA-adenine methylase